MSPGRSTCWDLARLRVPACRPLLVPPPQGGLGFLTAMVGGFREGHASLLPHSWSCSPESRKEVSFPNSRLPGTAERGHIWKKDLGRCRKMRCHQSCRGSNRTWLVSLEEDKIRTEQKPGEAGIPPSGSRGNTVLPTPGFQTRGSGRGKIRALTIPPPPPSVVIRHQMYSRTLLFKR